MSVMSREGGVWRGSFRLQREERDRTPSNVHVYDHYSCPSAKPRPFFTLAVYSHALLLNPDLSSHWLCDAGGAVCCRRATT